MRRSDGRHCKGPEARRGARPEVIPLMIMIEKPTEDGRDLRLPILSTDVLIQIQSFLDPKDILSLRKVLIVT